MVDEGHREVFKMEIEKARVSIPPWSTRDIVSRVSSFRETQSFNTTMVDEGLKQLEEAYRKAFGFNTTMVDEGRRPFRLISGLYLCFNTTMVDEGLINAKQRETV